MARHPFENPLRSRTVNNRTDREAVIADDAPSATSDESLRTAALSADEREPLEKPIQRFFAAIEFAGLVRGGQPLDGGKRNVGQAEESGFNRGDPAR